VLDVPRDHGLEQVFVAAVCDPELAGAAQVRFHLHHVYGGQLVFGAGLWDAVVVMCQKGGRKNNSRCDAVLCV